jgi:hypothetical protein
VSAVTATESNFQLQFALAGTPVFAPSLLGHRAMAITF